MSGIGDNFQLRTLLADRLIGDPARGLLTSEPPAPARVAAATTAPPQRPLNDPIQRRFRLFDGTGASIYPEGQPAGIPLLDGVRVIVLPPPPGSYGWACGRTHEHLVPALTLDYVMTPKRRKPGARASLPPARPTSSQSTGPRPTVTAGHDRPASLANPSRRYARCPRGVAGS
jgi:hypothetical protein